MTGDRNDAASDVLTALTGGATALAKALEAGGDANARDRWGVPLLAIAAGRGDLESVRLLLDHGADPNLASAVGNAPLMVAAALGHPDVARALLDAGARPTATNNWGLSAADWAQWAKDPAEIRALLIGRENES